MIGGEKIQCRQCLHRGRKKEQINREVFCNFLCLVQALKIIKGIGLKVVVYNSYYQSRLNLHSGCIDNSRNKGTVKALQRKYFSSVRYRLFINKEPLSVVSFIR